MPRPRQTDSRTLIAAFRVNREERLQLQRTAEEQGLSVSDLLRLTVIGTLEKAQTQA